MKRRGNWTKHDFEVVVGESLRSIRETGSEDSGCRTAAQILNRYKLHCQVYWRNCVRASESLQEAASGAKAEWVKHQELNGIKVMSKNDKLTYSVEVLREIIEHPDKAREKALLALRELGEPYVERERSERLANYKAEKGGESNVRVR